MQFIDEASIQVHGGKGGNGACSFLRLKFMPFGGPDGGNGGEGGSIFLTANSNLSTLMDYHYASCYHAPSGESGSRCQRAGKKGKDLILSVPTGTLVYNEETQMLLADLATESQVVCVAKGGKRGMGNMCFKSSTNRAPRRTTPGHPGESYHIRLELNLLADVGLIGLPNAGKSSLVCALSAARSKIADYPFTTLYPCLGVVRVSPLQSFVIADLPGLIAGAAEEGAGLGIRFLKHATRTRLLLHVIDIATQEISSVIKNIATIIHELKQFSPTLAQKECWLVLNKIDLLSTLEIQSIYSKIIQIFRWSGKIFMISSLTQKGLISLSQSVIQHLKEKSSCSAEQ